MHNDLSSGNLKIRIDIIKPIVDKVKSELQFRKFWLEIDEIAFSKSMLESPDIPISKIIHNLLPSEIKNLDLTHDEIVEIIMLAKRLDTYETKKSIEPFDKFLYGDSTKSQYWVEKGKFLCSDLFNSAIRCFDKALEIDANKLDVLHLKGLCLLELVKIGSVTVNDIWNDLRHFRDMVHEAMRCFEKIIEIDSTHAGAWYGKGVCLTIIGKFTKDYIKIQEAVDCFIKSLSFDSDNEDVKKVLKMCEESLRGNLQGKVAMKVQEKNQDMLKKGPDEFFNVLRQKIKDKDMEDAYTKLKRQDWSQILKENPLSEKLYSNLELNLNPDLGHIEKRVVQKMFESITLGISGKSIRKIQRQVAFGEFLLKGANACCGTPEQYCHTFWERFGPLCSQENYRGLKHCPCQVCEEYEGNIIGIHKGLFYLLVSVPGLLLVLLDIPTDSFSVNRNEKKIVGPLVQRENVLFLLYQTLKGTMEGNLPIPPPKWETLFAFEDILKDSIKTHLLLLTDYGFSFVMAHELAHFLLGHTADESLTSLEMEGQLAKVFVWTEEQKKEFEADEIGFTILLNSIYRRRNDIQVMGAIAGAEIVLFILELCEKIGKTIPSKTHPPAKDRIFQLRQKYKFPEKYYEISNSLAEFHGFTRG